MDAGQVKRNIGHRPRWAVAPTLIGLGTLMPLALTPAAAEPMTSAYTSFDTKHCAHRPGTAEEDYGSWSCPGYGKNRVLLSADDQRMFVSFGSSQGGLAASQTFPGFNSIYSGTVEWRVDAGRPFATILRWTVMTARDGEGAQGPVAATGRVLVVTRLDPGGQCHIGYVDARANPDANQLARTLADSHAQAFDCGKDRPLTVGHVGAGLALPGASD